jgi:hypothetical protein
MEAGLARPSTFGSKRKSAEILSREKLFPAMLASGANPIYSREHGRS